MTRDSIPAVVAQSGCYLAQSPNRVEARELMGVLAGDLGENADSLQAAVRQRELRLLPHAQVAMGQPPRDLLERAILHSLGEEFFCFEHQRIAVESRIVNAVDAA